MLNWRARLEALWGKTIAEVEISPSLPCHLAVVEVNFETNVCCHLDVKCFTVCIHTRLSYILTFATDNFILHLCFLQHYFDNSLCIVFLGHCFLRYCCYCALPVHHPLLISYTSLGLMFLFSIFFWVSGFSVFVVHDFQTYQNVMIIYRISFLHSTFYHLNL